MGGLPRHAAHRRGGRSADAEPLPQLSLGEPALLAQGPEMRSQLVRQADGIVHGGVVWSGRNIGQSRFRQYIAPRRFMQTSPWSDEHLTGDAARRQGGSRPRLPDLLLSKCRQSGAQGVMSDITIYHNPFCVISRNALALIRHAGIEPTVIDYLKNRPSRAKLLELLEAMQTPVRALVRVHSPYGVDLGLCDPAWTDDALLDLMLERPALLNRPIVVTPLGTKVCRRPRLCWNRCRCRVCPVLQGGRERGRGSRCASLVDRRVKTKEISQFLSCDEASSRLKVAHEPVIRRKTFIDEIWPEIIAEKGPLRLEDGARECSRSCRDLQGVRFQSKSAASVASFSA